MPQSTVTQRPRNAIGESPWYGVELEVEFTTGNRSKVEERVSEISFPDYPNGSRYFDRCDDGSLDRGLEFKSPPASLDTHLNGGVPWDRLTTICEAEGGKSHNTDTCGLHVHVSKGALTSQGWARVAVFLVSHAAMVDRIARRSENQYCRKIDKGPERRGWAKPRVEKYEALNFSPRYTREFRLFKGTLKVDTIKASILFTRLCVELAKNHTFRQLRDLSWHQVCAMVTTLEEKDPRWSLLRQYMEHRNAWTTRPDVIPAPVPVTEPEPEAAQADDDDDSADDDDPSEERYPLEGCYCEDCQRARGN